ncbi:MAG: hypothetical protein QXZ13_00020 [Candidatus Diapherotrites archaeon]
MNSNDFYFYFGAVLLVLIIILGSYVYFNYDFSTYKHVVERNGVSFVSNTDEPSVVLDRLRASNNILLAVDFVPLGSQNQYSTDAVTLFTTIFVAKGHKVTLLARVLDEKGSVVSCSSNFGDPKRNDVIDLVECSKMFSDSTMPLLYVSLPNANNSKSLVMLSGSRVEVFPNSFESFSSVCFVVAEAIYSDAAQLIGTVNFLVDRL